VSTRTTPGSAASCLCRASGIHFAAFPAGALRDDRAPKLLVLEIKLQSHLDVTFPLRGLNLAERGAVHVDIGRIEEWSASGIERFRAALETLRFSNDERFLQGEIQIPKSWAADD